MKIAAVIFSCNAGGSLWERVLKSYSEQEKVFDTCILVDSESSDSTVSFALEYNWQIRREKRAEFNYGRTRQKMIDELQSRGYDAVIFATQDVLPAAPDTLKVLVENLQQTGAAAAYARQIPVNEKSFDGFCRLRNYPPCSLVKSQKDIKKLGLMTPFCSNSLAVWDIRKVQNAGGFPDTVFGEDMLMGAELISAGEKISYCAESCCVHEHESTLSRIFRRGVDIGRLHGSFPELGKEFGTLGSCGVKTLSFREICRFFLPLAIKYCGYMAGYYGTRLQKLAKFGSGRG